jgi:hypothetical protein
VLPTNHESCDSTSLPQHCHPDERSEEGSAVAFGISTITGYGNRWDTRSAVVVLGPGVFAGELGCRIDFQDERIVARRCQRHLHRNSLNALRPLEIGCCT